MKAHPCVKWVGGKRQLLDQLRPLLPKSFNLYLKPFVGGGAMFFDLAAKDAVLADANPELIDCYKGIKHYVDNVIHELKRLPINEKTYYALRSLRPAELSLASGAARTIYLNKCCFNGLHRVNRSGGFNVPWGKWKEGHPPTTCDEENLRACSAALQGVDIQCGDFANTMLMAQEGDFCYCDSPYVPLTKTANFTAYTAGGFGPDDLKRLHTAAVEAAQRGAHVMLSNADTPEVRELFKDFHVHSVSARRNVNCDASKRGKVGEVVIVSYKVRT